MSGANPNETNSPVDWDRFHQELKAAVLAGIPLELGATKALGGSTLDLSQLSALQATLNDRMSRGQSLQQLVDDESLPFRYRASLKVFEQTGAIEPVLDGLAIGGRSRRQLSRLLRSTVVYLFFVIAAAYCGLLFFSNLILPTVESMRDDFLMLPSIDAPVRVGGTSFLQAGLVILPLGLLLFLVIVFFMGGSSTIASWLGGRRYQTHRASATALRSTRALVARGLPVAESVSLSCDLVGGDAAVKRQVDGAVRERSTAEATAEHLEILANHFQSSAANRMAVLNVLLPMMLVLVVGGAAVAIHSFAVFLPLVVMIRDMTLPGT